MTKLSSLLEVALGATSVGVELIKTVPPGTLTAKGDRDMATEADYAIERAIRKLLHETTPDIDFLGEEDGQNGDRSEWTWVLDPIDGTVNFLHGMPLCAISLGLLRRGRPVLGVIELPWLGSRFTAIEGEGAYENGMPIQISTITSLTEAVVAIGDYSVSANADAKNRVRLAITAELAGRVQRVRMFGSAAIDLAWLASGRIDASITMSNNPWDMTAGVVIAREAGAVVVDAASTPHTGRSAATIASAPKLLGTILPIVASTSQ